MSEPGGDAFVGLSIIDAVGEDDSTGSFEIRLGDVSISLLAGSVPDLQFDFTAVDGNSF